MRVLITGSRGYIGSRLCQIIRKQFKKITIKGVDSNFYNYKEKWEHHYENLDIRDLSLFDFKKIDSVIHLASLSNDPLGSLNKKLTREINYKATVNMGRLAKKAGVKRFIFISTQSVYGISKNKNTLIKESEKNIKPITEYAISKLKAEKILLKLANKNFCVCIFRPSTVHGASQNFRSDIVLNNLCGSAFANKKIIIKTNGKPYRPILFIDDLCKIIISSLTKNKLSINRQIFNAGYPGKNYSIIEIANLTKKIFKNVPIEILNNPSHDERSYKVNFNKISKTFSEVINFKKKNVYNDIIKLRKFFIQNKFNKKILYGEKTNRILMLKKLLKKKFINKNLRFKI